MWQLAWLLERMLCSYELGLCSNKIVIDLW